METYVRYFIGGFVWYWLLYSSLANYSKAFLVFTIFLCAESLTALCLIEGVSKKIGGRGR